MKKFLSSLIISALIFGTQTTLASFPDVATNFHQYEAINWLQENGVVEGYADGTFQPEKYVNRAEFLKMLYEIQGETHGTGFINLPFPDVDENAWYFQYVAQAYLDGIIEGYPDGTFRPESTINVVEALKIVNNRFTDIVIPFDEGFSNCENGNAIQLDEALETNERLAAEIPSLTKINKDAWYWRYLKISGELCLLDNGFNANGMGGLKIDSYVDRGDMAELLYRSKATWDASSGLEPYYEGLVPEPLSPQIVEQTELEGTITEINEDWNEYRNERLGFKINFPKKNYNGDEVLETKVVESGEVVYLVGHEYIMTEISEKKDQSNYEKSKGVPFGILVEKVANETELEEFLQKRYAPECKLAGLEESETPGIYDVGIDTSDSDFGEGCFINYITIVKYSPEKGMVATWDIGQDMNFLNGEVDEEESIGDVQYMKSLDFEISDSFEFL